MRIAYLCADRGIPVAGNKGASIHVRSVAQALAQRGHDVTVAALRVDGESPSDYLPGTVEIPYDRTYKALRRSIDGDGQSVLSSEIYSLLLNSASHEGLAGLEQDGGVDAVYERYSLWSVAGIRFARLRRIPYLLEVNAPLVHEQQLYRELRLSDAAEGIERFLFSEADAIFVPSTELAEYISRKVGKRRRLYVTPNGVDLDRFAPPSPLADPAARAPKERFRIVFLGSLKPWHGIGVLLDAFEQLRTELPGAELLVLGHGPLRDKVEEFASRLGPEAVNVTGEVPHQQIPKWLREADVGVAPYPEIEEFYFSPLKVIEYMAAGLPVVASSIGQLRHLVCDEHTGLLVTPGDPESLAAALRRLAEDRKLRARLGRRARERAISKHGWDKVAGRIDEVLQQLAAKSDRQRHRVTPASDRWISAGGVL